MQMFAEPPGVCHRERDHTGNDVVAGCGHSQRLAGRLATGLYYEKVSFYYLPIIL